MMGVEKKSFSYGGDCFEGSKLDGGAFSEDSVVESHDYTARRHSELISLLASSDTNSARGMANVQGGGGGGTGGTGRAWEQSRVFGQDAGRIQMGELHAGDGECSPEEEQSEGFSGGRGECLKKKELKRAWREEWKSKHRWVYPMRNADGELRLKCHWCTYYNMDNVFAREGCSTIQMSALNTHAKSEAHKAAESRIAAADGSVGLPESLFDGSKSCSESGLREQVDADDTPGKKRKVTPTFGSTSRAENLASTIQKNNSRIVQLLLDAESGRNARHATNVALARRQIKIEQQRLQVEQNLLQQDKVKFDAHVSLGQSFVAALTDFGEGLKKIASAMEARKTRFEESS